MAPQTLDLRSELDQSGFAIIPKVLTPSAIAELMAAVERGMSGPTALRRGRSAYGFRDLLGRVPEVRRLAHAPEILALVEPILGPSAFPVRGLWFDKTPGANWNLPWHRDLTIAVRRRVETPGYRCWTFKVGIPHVYPPVEVLRKMLTLRLHLDETGPDNGPLLVLPGSQRVDHDAVAVEAVGPWRDRVEPVACLVPCGGAVLMRPLLLHSSDSARTPEHRRVIHLEYAADPLPGGLEWYETGTEFFDDDERIANSGGEDGAEFHQDARSGK